MKRHSLGKILFAVAIAVVSCGAYAIDPIATAAFMHQLANSPELAGAGLCLGTMSGDAVTEIKKLIEDQGKQWDEFKKTNDQLIQAKADGKAVADLEAKLAKVNEDLTKTTKELIDLSKKQNRPSLGGKDISEEQTEHKTAWTRWVKSGDENGLRDVERKAMQGASDPDSGYFATTEIESAVERLLGTNVAMMNLATVRTIGGSSYKKAVRTQGAGHVWVGDTEEPGETSTPRYAELEVTPGTIAAEPQISVTTLEDSGIDLEAEVLDALDQAFSEGVGAALISGNGVKKPRGLLAYDTVDNANYAWGKLGFVKSGHASNFAAANPSDRLIDLVHALKSGYRGNAGWLMNDMTLAAIRKFKDGQGQYLWQPGLQAGVAGLLLGYPVSSDDNMPDLAADALPIAFGDFKRGYLVVRRRGVVMLRDPYTKKSWVKYYTTLRMGGAVQNFESIKLMKVAA